MATDKNTRMLNLFYKLILGYKVNKQLFCLEEGITERSFDRDIQDVRSYLSEKQPYCKVLYDRVNNNYYMTHTLGKKLESEETLFLINVLLSKKYLRDDELNGILTSLINNTDSATNRMLLEFVNSKKVNQIDQNCSVAILKMHWDLAKCIYKRNQITIFYKLEENKIVTRKLNPVELHYEDGHIYLIAYIVGRNYEYPAFYRLDRITSFKLHEDKYPQDLKLNFENKNIHKNLVGMMAGDRIDVTVKVMLSLKRVIMDIFTKYRLIEETNEYCIFEIYTFKQGFISWLLGQRENVELIEPKELRKEIMVEIDNMRMLYINK